MTEPDSNPSVVRLACPSCGGMLPLPSGTNEYLTCPFCHSTLHLRRSASEISLEMAYNVGRAIGQEVEQHIDQQFQDLQSRQHSQLLEIQLQNLRGQLLTLQSLPKSRQREQAMKQVQSQLNQVESQYRQLYARSSTTVQSSPYPAAQKATGSGRGCLWVIIGFFAFPFAIFGLGIFGVTAGLLGTVLALFSTEYRDWLNHQRGYLYRLSKLPGLGSSSPGGLAVATFFYLVPFSVMCMVALASNFIDGSMAKIEVPGTVLVGIVSISMLYGWFIHGWGLPKVMEQKQFSGAAIIVPIRRNLPALIIAGIALLIPAIFLIFNLIVAPVESRPRPTGTPPQKPVTTPTVGTGLVFPKSTDSSSRS